MFPFDPVAGYWNCILWWLCSRGSMEKSVCATHAVLVLAALLSLDSSVHGQSGEYILKLQGTTVVFHKVSTRPLLGFNTPTSRRHIRVTH